MSTVEKLEELRLSFLILIRIILKPLMSWAHR